MKLGIAIIVVVCLLVAGCGGGNKLVGKWQDQKSGMMTMEFTAEGKMTASAFGVTSPAVAYKVEGSKITFGEGAGARTTSFTLAKDVLTIGEGTGTATLIRVK